MPTPPAGFLSRLLLQQLAGEEQFARGEQHFASSRVRQMRSTGNRVSARVAGAPSHRVKLWGRGDELRYSCDCQAGREETFCEHCVAVGLAWISRAETQDVKLLPTAGGAPVETEAEAHAQREQDRSKISAHLATLDRDRLVSLILEATDYDEILRRRLLLEALGIAGRPGTKSLPSGPLARPELGAYRRLLREAIGPSGYVDFHAMPDYAQGVEEAIRPLADLIRAGWCVEAIELTEFALVELDLASDKVDTGDALLNKVYDDLQAYHLEACRAGSPDREELAGRLLHYELEGGLGVFNNAARTYAEILGTEGLEAWRRALLREWNALVPNAPAKLPPTPTPAPIDHRRFQVRMLMERQASSEADTTALLSIKSSDLGSIYDFVALAEWFESGGRYAEAIACAQQALGRFPARNDQRVLREYLIPAYQRAARPAEALPLVWAQFSDSPDVESFRELKNLVASLDADEWPRWRARSLEWARGAAPLRRAWETGADHTGLVAMLLEEHLYDAAWDAAQAGYCRDDLLLRVANHQETKYPLDAAGIYQRKISALITTHSLSGYREAIELLACVKSLFSRLQLDTDYGRYLAELRAIHRQKRTFLRLLAAAGH